MLNINPSLYAAERGDIGRASNQPLEDWLGHLRVALEEADNVLDEMEIQPLREEMENHRLKGTKKKIVKFVKRAAKQGDMVKRLKKVVKIFDHLVSGLDTFAQVLTSLAEPVEMRGETSQETGSVFTGVEFFGREEEIKMVLDWLTTSEKKKLSVFSIVGVSGVGKTALAQHLFDHKELESFEAKIWVSVSNKFDEKVITKKVLESLTQKESKLHTLNVAQRTLKDLLSTKKLLIVLDDVWNDKERGKWEKLMAPLRYGADGSKILLTTRMESVADLVSKVVGEPKIFLNLEGLEERENMLLFEKYAFASLHPKDYPRLQLIGNEIALKLRGIPLAIKTIGAMLNDRLEDEYWAAVLDDGTLMSDKGSDGIMAAIKLSYDHLLPELKPCFRYCSLFPRDHKFIRQELLDMWISVGLIPEGEKGQDEVANSFFDTFVQKSFFESKGLYYTMHDLFHELALILSKNECMQVVTNEPIQIPQSIRHLSLTTNDIRVLKNLGKLKYLRTFLLQCDIEDVELKSVMDTALEGFKTLRYLKVSSRHLSDFPESIGNLFHLRCLCITGTSISTLSPCVCTLFHLQFLDFTLNNQLNSGVSIPLDICKLLKLRKLHLPRGGISEIQHIGKLTYLQQLKEYIVRPEVGYHISELEMMSELRELLITNLENVINTEEASKAKISSKHNLRNFTLKWCSDRSRNESDKQIADCLQPHPRLTDLSLLGYRSSNPPRWLEAKYLPNLTAIRLAMCDSFESLPPLGQLPYLKCLNLEFFMGLKRIGSDFYGSSQCGNSFPSLEIFTLQELVMLEEWTQDTQSKIWFPHLKTLQISGCPNLKELPPIPASLKELMLNEVGIDAIPGMKEQNAGSSTNHGPEFLSLIIKRCSKLISLRSGIFSHPDSACLQKLIITDCDELIELPCFTEHIGLRSITIQNCSKILLLPECQSKSFFPPATQQIMLSSCGNLVACVPKFLPGLSFLSLLKLEHCAKLKSLPSENVLQCLTALKQLEILHCGELQSLSGVEAIPFLKILVIRKCPMLTTKRNLDLIKCSPRNKNSVELEELDIDCQELLSLEPLRSMHLTQRVCIIECHEVTYLLEEWLMLNAFSLQTLVVVCSDSIEELPNSLKFLTRLKVLMVKDGFGISCLPELPPSLGLLIIDGCKEEFARSVKVGGPSFDNVRNLEVAVLGVRGLRSDLIEFWDV